MKHYQPTSVEVKTLRELSGEGMLDCRKSLIEAKGDMEKAALLLKEREQKHLFRLITKRDEKGNITS